MTEYINIPFPKALYDKIVIRSGGALDPVWLAEHQVEQFVERTVGDFDYWTDEGVEQWEEEWEHEREEYKGDPNRGYQWRDVHLPNGTRLKMTYKGDAYFADVRHEKVRYEGHSYSPSQWAGEIANNTARNAWRDIWLQFPKKTNWELAANVRRKIQAEA